MGGDLKFQRELVKKLRSGKKGCYEDAAIYTILLDLVMTNDTEDIVEALNSVISDLGISMPKPMNRGGLIDGEIAEYNRIEAADMARVKEGNFVQAEMSKKRRDDLFFEVPILPSEWVLDVYVGLNENIPGEFIHRYGGSACEYSDLAVGSKMFVTDVRSTIDSVIGGDTRIVLCIEGDSYSDKILVHELLHVLWRYGKLSGCSVTDETQEWQSVLLEYLFEKVKAVYEIKE